MNKKISERFSVRVLLVAALAFMASLHVPPTAMAQVPNPKGIAGSITTSGATDHAYIISLRQMTTGNNEKTAKFISNFVVSDSCRIVIKSIGLDSKFKSSEDADIGNYPDIGVSTDYYAEEWVPLVADHKHNFKVNADYMILYIYGDARTVSFTGVVEYHD